MSDFESLSSLITVAALAGVTLLGVAVFLLMRGARPDPMNRFSAEAASTATPEAGQETTLRRSAGREIKALDNFSRFLEPENAEELSASRQRMIQAGYHGRNAVRDFHALQFILAIGGLLVSTIIAFAVLPDRFDSPISLALIMLLPMLIGYFGPRRWIESRIEKRREEILSGFPDALDMMLICVEAGQSLDQSIRRVADEIRPAYPALSEELSTVGEQTRAGRERSEVLKDMAKRCDISDITSFATVMVQAATYGTSITDALRVFAAEMRDKRIMRAEEKANMLPTKMTLGTMMFTVPPLLIILIGPSVVGIMADLSGGIAP